jgi:hypothetical protein
MNRYFESLLFAAADGKPSEMETLRRFKIEDFFQYITNKEKNARS